MVSITPKNIHKILSKNILVDHFDIVLDLEKSQGNYIYDSKNKRKLLDCFSFIASNPIGHNHPKLNDKTFEKKLLRCAKTNPSNSDILSLEYGEAIETFARIAKPKEFKHLFFVAGGSVAVENALKTAFDWKCGKLRARGIEPEANKLEVIHFYSAFHGRTTGSLGLTNTDPIKYKDFPKFNWPRFYAPTEGPNVEKELKKTKAALETYIHRKKDTIASLVLEPIFGEGGDRHFPIEFHQFLREITLKNDIMLIYDEVQTGIGLTGKMWAYEHFGIVPDVVSFGKKTQVCGIMSTDRVDEVYSNVFNTSSRINSTFGGNLVDFVRCERYLEIIKEDKLVENAAKVGAYLLEILGGLHLQYPKLVSNPRGKGLMCAFDLPTTELRNKFVQAALKNELLLLGCGDRSIRFRPSLTFSAKEVDQVNLILEKVLKSI